MKQVLNVGQCDYDHDNIQAMITRNFDAVVVPAQSQREAIELAQQESWAVILVNRLLDADGGSGLELIKALKADPVTRSIPVMLVSNFVDAQKSAIELGALPGFGKSTLNTQATLAELTKVLG
jgi:two-component system chemotaxis response regulator CheY